MSNKTPAARWRENGEPDPHAKYSEQERAELPLGNLTDDELANAVFLHGDTVPPLAEVIAGTAKMPIAYLTAAKERIRWLSRKLVKAERQRDELLEARSGTGMAIDAAIRDGVVPDEHPLLSRLEMLANHRQREQELQAEVERVNNQINEMPGMDAFDEFDRLKQELSLISHKLITCGVAARHPDPALSSRESDYGGKWNSPQAEAVRITRRERDELLAVLGELLDRGLFFASGIERGDDDMDFEDWESRARAAISKSIAK